MKSVKKFLLFARVITAMAVIFLLQSETASAQLCKVGTASAITKSGNKYTWTCSGEKGGKTASCSADEETTKSNKFYWGKFGGVPVIYRGDGTETWPKNPHPGCTAHDLQDVPPKRLFIWGSYKVACFDSNTKLMVDDSNCAGAPRDSKVQDFCYISFRQEDGTCKHDFESLPWMNQASWNFGAKFGDKPCTDETLLLPGGDGWWDWERLGGRGMPLSTASPYPPDGQQYKYTAALQPNKKTWDILGENHKHGKADPSFSDPWSIQARHCLALEMIHSLKRCR